MNNFTRTQTSFSSQFWKICNSIKSGLVFLIILCFRSILLITMAFVAFLLTSIIYDFLSETNRCRIDTFHLYFQCAGIGGVEFLYTIFQGVFTMAVIWPLIACRFLFYRGVEKWRYLGKSAVISSILILPLLFLVPILGAYFSQILDVDIGKCNFSSRGSIYNYTCMRNGFYAELIILCFYLIFAAIYAAHLVVICLSRKIYLNRNRYEPI